MGLVECLMWERREAENYFCSPATLEAYAAHSASADVTGPLFAEAEATRRVAAMREAIDEIGEALERMGRGSPWSADVKASDDFLDPLFRAYFEKLDLPNLMAKKNFHELVDHVPPEEIAGEVRDKLDAVVRVASGAEPGSARH